MGVIALPKPYDDAYWMARALTLAQRAFEVGEVPVGAVLIKNGVLVSAGYNQPISACDPSAHAEIIALRKAAQKLSNYRLPGTTLYVTLEPCAMCAGALIQARVERVVFGAGDSRNGACGSVFNVLQSDRLNHQAEVMGGVLAEDCADLLRVFFRRKREESGKTPI
jgi:tRNA(adenine34) deaminase